jgi:hypothetical protein
MHPTTCETLAKAHIRDLQPGRTWPTDTAPESGSAGFPLATRLATMLLPRFARSVAALGRWIRRPVSA